MCIRDSEQRGVAVGADHGGGVQQADLAVRGGVVPAADRFHPQHLAAAVPGRVGERVEGGLPPCRPARLGHDRRDHVDQLGQAGRGDPVAVPQQGDQQGADHHRVGDTVAVLQQSRCDCPLGLVRRVEGPLVPDVPLVEGQLKALARAQSRADVVAGGHHAVDEVLHVLGTGQEAVHVTVDFFVVGVAGHVVHQVVAVLQHGGFPRAERRHAGAGAAARHQAQVRVDLAHGPRGLRGQPAVLLGGLVAGLPRPVHLVAQAPQPDPVGLVGAVLAAQLGAGGATGVVGVLQQVARLAHTPGAQVDRHHRLDPGPGRERHELAEAELVGLHGFPGGVQPPWPLGDRPHPVLPAVGGDEVAARVAHHGHAEFGDQRQHVGAQSGVVGGRVSRLEQSGVDAPAEVLDERAEQPGVDLPDGEVRVEHQRGAGLVRGRSVRHRPPFHERTGGGWVSRRRASPGRPSRSG